MLQREALCKEFKMNRTVGFSLLALGLAFTAVPANAVVYCKAVGVPKGCVVRPARVAPVVYCKSAGVPKGCVVRPVANPRVGVSPTNRDGGLNRLGPNR